MVKKNISHVAFILDGNKRWAKKNNLSNVKGYFKGFENIKNIVNHCFDVDISNLTLFTLSSENFNRPSIKIIYEIIYNNFSNLLDDMIKNRNIKIKIIGTRDKLPNKIIEIFDQSEKLTKNNDKFNLNLAFNYGFKEEIKEVLLKFKKNQNLININKNEHINNLFYLGNLPEPDILIRTGGYKRLSNFIMYNLTYTELFFTDTLWPDFSTSEFNKIIQEYKKINRNYGL